MFIDLIFIFVAESHLDFQRCGVSCITLFALFDRVFDVIFAKREVYKLQAKMSSKVSDRRDIVKDLFQALVEEPSASFFPASSGMLYRKQNQLFRFGGMGSFRY